MILSYVAQALVLDACYDIVANLDLDPTSAIVLLLCWHKLIHGMKYGDKVSLSGDRAEHDPVASFT